MPKQPDKGRCFRPKKYRGQNFLIDNNLQRKIVGACGLTPQDTVLEIGAGRGELTRLIARQAKRVFAVEQDAYLCSLLKHNLKSIEGNAGRRVRIINQDILRFNILRRFKDIAEIKVIGNLPYNITTPIIAHLLKFYDKIGEIFITIQKEFAFRAVAAPGSVDWSAFSCFLQYHTQPAILFFIKKTCFWPRPEVDSALVRLAVRERLALEGRKQKELFKIIRFSFQQRRKTLRNALRGLVTDVRLERYFDQFGISRDIRGERLCLQDFINLVNM